MIRLCPRLFAVLFAAIAFSTSACDPVDDSGQAVFDRKVTLTLGAPQVLSLGDEQHTFTVLEVYTDRAVLQIESEPVIQSFSVGKPQQVDLDGDGAADLVVLIEKIEGDKVTAHLRDPGSASADGGSIAAVQEDPWGVAPSEKPAGNLLNTLTISSQAEGPIVLYDIAPVLDACTKQVEAAYPDHPSIYAAYLEETGGRIRIEYSLGGSRSFPYFEITTEEKRPRYSECVDEWGHGPMTTTELTLDKRVGVDLEGDGDLDVDAVLHQVRISRETGTATVTVLIYERE